LVPFYEYDESRFFATDGAPEEHRRGAARRFHAAQQGVCRALQEDADLTDEMAGGVSDLQFTSRYRVPFQFSAYVRRHFKSGGFVDSSSGVTVTDLDGIALRSDGLLRGQRVRLGLLQGLHRAPAPSAFAAWAGAGRISSRDRL